MAIIVLNLPAALVLSETFDRRAMAVSDRRPAPTEWQNLRAGTGAIGGEGHHGKMVVGIGSSRIAL